MIDGIKIEIPINDVHIATHLITLFDLNFQIRQRTSDERFRYIGNLNNLIIEFNFNEFTGRLIIRGSLHKFYHNLNSNDFLWNELDQVIRDILLSSFINIVQLTGNGRIINKYKQLTFPLTQVEVGVNIIVGIDDLPSFLDINLIQHKKEPFRKTDNLVYKCKHDDYFLKVYPKGKNLLRIEMVFLSKELKKYNILTLSDLTKAKIRPMAERLKREIKEIIFADGIDIYTCKEITKSEETKLLRFTSDWRNKQYLFNNKYLSKRGRKNSGQRMWTLGAFCKKTFESKGVGYKKEIISLVDQKVDELLSLPGINDV